MARAGKYLAVYDISSSRERRLVSRVLEGYGIRVQESVFECRLNRALREKLCRQLEKLELETGFILLYRLRENAGRLAVGSLPAGIVGEEEHAFVV